MTTGDRPRLSLDGTWQFRTDPQGDLTPASPGPWRTADVPGPWQAQSDDLRAYRGVAWYRRAFEVPHAWADSRVVLLFGAVDYLAEVFVNGDRVGAHEGGYLPFELDVTQWVAVGRPNELAVRVTDPDDDRSRWDVTFGEIPHGKQSWYGALSGIWQSVALEARPALHVRRLRVTPDARTGEVELRAALSMPADPGVELAVALLGPDGRVVAEGAAPAEELSAALRLRVDSPQLWELDSPALYTAVATLSGDAVRERFGFRTLESRDGALFLNGRPLMLRGALDQDYYPDGFCTPPSTELLARQMQLAKRMGLNCLRCHIKVADPRYLAAADEAGVLVWAELPNWASWTPEVGARGVATLLGAIERDWNHPSVVIWTVINESWGIDQTDPAQRAWLRSAFDEVKAAAGDRLVVDNSACFANFHLKSDLDDYHFYAAMPDERGRWRDWVAQFAARAPWSYGAERPEIPRGVERWTLGQAGYGAPLPEVERSGQEPLIVSEFGNWGLPSLAELRGPEGRDPWWFETGDDWSDSVVYPHGVERRFARLGLAKLFGDYEGFTAATRRSELDALRFEIEEMRRHPSIGGYVITEFTDVHWECNGLLDMRRNPKMPLEELAALNADTLLIPDREGGALRSGEVRRIALHASHWGAEPIEDASVRLSASAEGVELAFAQETSALAVRSSALLGAVVVTAPDVERPRAVDLRVELLAGGRCVAETSVRLAVYPQPQALPSVYVYDAPELRDRLDRLGYGRAELPGDGPTVATRFDAALRERALRGERVLVLASDEDSLQAPAGPLAVRARKDTHWQGSWASSFCWAAGEWAGGSLLDDSFSRVMPTHVVAGLSPASFPASADAGLCVGWVQRAAALTATVPMGVGELTVTTFRLAEALGEDPVADAMFARLLAR